MDKLKERIETARDRAGESRDSATAFEETDQFHYYDGKVSAYADILLMIKTDKEGL